MRAPTQNQALMVHLLVLAAVLMQQAFAIIIQPGDTLARIAAEQGVPVAALEAANPGISINDLQPGQVLKTPGTTSSASSSSRPTSSSKSTSSTSKSSTSTSSTSKSSTSTSSTSTSSTSTSSTSTSSTTPPPPPPAPASPTSSIPELTSVGSAICAPSPVGKYSDANDVIAKTYTFCNDNGHHTLASLLAPPHNGILSGSSQELNSDDGDGGVASNEKGYNMTISAVPGCTYPESSSVNYTVGQPMGTNSPDAWWCTAVLTNCYNECNNEGMGGQLQTGCFLYVFEPDP